MGNSGVVSSTDESDGAEIDGRPFGRPVYFGWLASDAQALLSCGAGRHGDPQPTPLTSEDAQASAEQLREGRNSRFVQLGPLQIVVVENTVLRCGSLSGGASLSSL
jgi:hypothetical protein